VIVDRGGLVLHGVVHKLKSSDLGAKSVDFRPMEIPRAIGENLRRSG